MKPQFFIGAAVLAALAQTPPAASQYPRQQPLPVESLESCRAPVYSDDDFRAMSEVREVSEVRAKFPGSYMFVPATPGPHPGVMLLHGSGGGRFSPGARSCLPRFLASRGYATLAFCWFDCGDDAIPQALADIDLKRTYDAMVWLKQSPHVGGGKVLVSGASRGAEKVSLFASVLGHAAKSDKSIVLPDAVYASAVYGRVVGGFNWRANANHERWKVTGGNPADCWVEDPKGRHTGPDGRRRSWIASKCAAEPNWATMFDVPAWRWERDPARVTPGIDIDLSLYPGPIMVVQGSTDPLWSVENGPDYLRRTLTARGVRSHYEVVPKLDRRIDSWPPLPDERVLFYIFDDEPHAFSTYATIGRRNLMLAFLDRTLGAMPIVQATQPDAPEIVTVPSGTLQLKALLWRPKSGADVPAVLFHHGGGCGEVAAVARVLGPRFAQRGYAFLGLSRRGTGASRGQGDCAFDQIRRVRSEQGEAAALDLQLHVMTTSELDDAMAGLAALRTLPGIDASRIAVAGHSFGGQLAILSAERDRGIRAVVNLAGAAVVWERSPNIRDRLVRAVGAVNVPLLLAYAEDDNAEPGRVLAAELARLGRPHELRIYPAGGHGFIVRPDHPSTADLFQFLENHLRGVSRR